MNFKRNHHATIYKIVQKKKDESKWMRMLPVANEILDLLLKIGALSIALGLLTCIFYLKSIGFSSLISSAMTSGSGGGSISLGFGVGWFFLLFLMLVTIIPLMVLYVKNNGLNESSLHSKSFEKWLSARYLFVLFFLFPLLFIAASVTFDEANFNKIIILEFVILILMIVLHARKDRHLSVGDSCYLVVLLVLFACLSLTPWIFFLNAITQSWMANKDDLQFQFILVFLIDSTYALCVAFVIEKFEKNKDGYLGWIKALLWAVLAMSILIGYVSPNIFLKSIMNFSGIRENSVDAQWHYIEKSEFLKLPKDLNIHGFKLENNNWYFCSYSIFNYGENTVLCPSDVVEGNSSSCFVFDAKKVRPIPDSPTKGWNCHPPLKKRLGNPPILQGAQKG